MRVAQKIFLCRCIEISFQSSFIENLGVILVLIPFYFWIAVAVAADGWDAAAPPPHMVAGGLDVVPPTATVWE